MLVAIYTETTGCYGRSRVGGPIQTWWETTITREHLDFLDDAVQAALCGAELRPLNPLPTRTVRDARSSWGEIEWSQQTTDESLVHKRAEVRMDQDEWAGARFEACFAAR